MANSLDYTVDMMYEESEPESTPIKDYFRGKTVLLTGGTGFLGLLYVEKLLRYETKTEEVNSVQWPPFCSLGLV